MQLINHINPFDVSLFEGKPYHLQSIDNLLKHVNPHYDALFLTLFYNTLEVYAHYGLVSFKDIVSGVGISNDSRIHEVRLFVNGYLYTEKYPPVFHYAMDLGNDTIENFLDSITAHKLRLSYITDMNNDCMLVSDSKINIDDINTLIRQFNDALITIATTFTEAYLEEDSITQTLIRHVPKMVDVDLVDDVMKSSWTIVVNHAICNNYDELFKIRDYLNDGRMKFVPNLKKNMFSDQ